MSWDFLLDKQAYLWYYKINMQSILPFISANIFVYFLTFLAFFLALVLLWQLKKAHYLIYFLLIWYPFESLLLRFVPVEFLAYAKYLPEVLLYLLLLISWAGFVWREKKIFPITPINKWLLGFVVVSIFSLILNWYSPWIWLLGLRQILRFMAVFFAMKCLDLDQDVIRKILRLILAIFVIEVFLAFVQYVAGGRLDRYLFPPPIVDVGNTAGLGEVEQFWVPGSRVFATFGRYDRLGSFLALGLVMLFPWFYVIKEKTKKIWLSIIWGAGSLALLLTMSRASWVGAFMGVLAIAWFIKKDKRLLKIAGILLGILVVYLLGFALVRGQVMSITDSRNQTLAERVFESFSLKAWRESYEGFGRIFFIINTPKIVVASAPLFGVGPGNFGGGVAASLLNTRVYERLHLPFGIQNLYGQIDNSLFSLWAELGTLGLICWLGIFVYLIRGLQKNTLSVGLFGGLIAVLVMGFFGPYLEFRPLMFYFWTLAGSALVLQNTEFKQQNF